MTETEHIVSLLPYIHVTKLTIIAMQEVASIWFDSIWFIVIKSLLLLFISSLPGPNKLFCYSVIVIVTTLVLQSSKIAVTKEDSCHLSAVTCQLSPHSITSHSLMSHTHETWDMIITIWYYDDHPNLASLQQQPNPSGSSTNCFEVTNTRLCDCDCDCVIYYDTMLQFSHVT